MSHMKPTFEELLEAYMGPDEDRYGDDDAFEVEESDAGEGYVFVDYEMRQVVFHEPYDVTDPKLADHLGHSVGIDSYDVSGIYCDEIDDIENLAITCHDCDTVIYDVEAD